MTATAGNDEDMQTAVAVIGMAARIPGVADIDEFWAALVAGRDLTTRLDSGRTYGVVAGTGWFDAAFFGVAPRDAQVLDPQNRVFLECTWEALEHAGYDPNTYPGAIGVYAGSGETDHFAVLRSQRQRFPDMTDEQLRLAASRDFLTSRVAYTLNLRGPAVTVYTACSTSLVAVHLACQALLAGDCDIALAGGVSLRGTAGDTEDVDLVSPGGCCRPFDADADGMVGADGAGIVVLKRLPDALADGDHVDAVLRGSALSNDGSGKVGFTAPSVPGQVAAISSAYLLAGVPPDTIGYVEAHGTGTTIGDAIEVRALSEVFGPGSPQRCVLGSVKSNIGHSDTAAGVIGLIKVVLSLRHGLIPGTAHFRRPNPHLDLAAGPFVVTREATPWPVGNGPRRAGVNATGIGGTNAHVLVEEAPTAPLPPDDDRYHLLPLSARTASALVESAARLRDRLRRDPVVIADAAWTLQTGRAAFAHRAFVVCRDRDEAVRGLTGLAEHAQAPVNPATGTPHVAFLFPGEWGGHVGMARELYVQEPVFRAVIDDCAARAAADLGLDLRQVLYPEPGAEAEAQARLTTMTVCQPALFAVQHAMAELWGSRGLSPHSVLGYSLGGYGAAVSAGVLTMDDALSLVLTRGRLLDRLPESALLAVPLPEADLLPMLADDMAIAAVDGPRQCVVSGPTAGVEQLLQRLAGLREDARRLPIASAAHSVLVDDIIDEYADAVASVQLRPPRLPWISDRTGAPVVASDACDPAYWVAHLRHTVRFSDALETLLAGSAGILLEVGPGHALGNLARQHPGCGPGRTIVRSLPDAAERAGGAAESLRATGVLWQAGRPVRWSALHHGRPPQRVPLSTYPFQRERFAVDDPAPVVAAHTPPSAAEPVSGHDADRAATDPRTPVEKAIAEVWRAVLRVQHVGIDDNFFELGGHSLHATRVLARLGQVLGADAPRLTIMDVFDHATIRELAALVSGSDPREGAGSDDLRRTSRE
ncbi:acyltransferase domain-containing protein [Kibdelosporangium philippinense]|uniref:Acyltransferase domain-containing protein n=1 Tax=Kibdelosporangium philippinense TaxID=211113 RepID=A0ABS8ZCF4_9PSEU|nr:type I polyketide synthase [Kibdelosporangium philippinense]MCE7004693.1 acyltransferase domain-containing protein [Kibdelosporangium philippinense]